MGNGCMEKLDGEFIWWVLFKGRTGERKKEFRTVMEKYKEKVTVIRNQKQLNRYYRNAGILKGA